jgi:hypothetical protein
VLDPETRRKIEIVNREYIMMSTVPINLREIVNCEYIMLSTVLALFKHIKR